MSRTIFTPRRRRQFYLDSDGIPTTVKDDDAVEDYTIDWADELDSGETISTSTWTGDGVTIDSSSNTTTTTTATISQTSGYAKNTVVTSDSRTLVRRLRFRSEAFSPLRDYGG